MILPFSISFTAAVGTMVVRLMSGSESITSHIVSLVIFVGIYLGLSVLRAPIRETVYMCLEAMGMTRDAVTNP